MTETVDVESIGNREKSILITLGFISLVLGCLKIIGSLSLALNEVVTAVMLIISCFYYSYTLLIFCILMVLLVEI